MNHQKRLLQMENIHLSYGNTRALNGVDFDLYRGEIHAIVGEHGAGKSSLVRILSGGVPKQRGRIILDDKEFVCFTPQSAINAGIGTVFQEIQLIPQFTAVENVFASRMPQSIFGAVNRDAMIEKCKSLFESLHIDVELGISVSHFTPPEQCMICVARSLAFDPCILILDEINQKLTPTQMKVVYDLIYQRKASDQAVIYISDDIDEILRLADRVTILKNGSRRATELTKDLDNYKLYKLTYSYALRNKVTGIDRLSSYIADSFFTELMQALPLGIILVDTAGSIRIANQRALEIMDTNPDTVKNRILKEVLDDLQFERGGEVWDKIVNRERYEWDELKITGAKAVTVRVYPIQDRDNTALGSTVLIQDTSLERYLEEYLVMTEKTASIAEVATGVAHEINNPLCSIKNYLSLIKSERLDQNSKTRLKLIENEINRIVVIVSSLLSFSRSKDIVEANVDIPGVVAEVVMLLNHQLVEKEINIEVSTSGEDISIFGKENKIKQLILNLVVNSIDAVLQGGKISIVITRLTQEDVVEIKIRDNGYGIPQDIQAKIFEPFFSTKVNRKNTGLGLSICRHIVDEHGGLIRFQSDPGRGTVFIVQLPRRKAT